MSAAAVEAQNLEKNYRNLFRPGTRALAGVSLKVEPGIIFGLLGENGAGKTTLVKILLGLVLPTAGSSRVFGHDPFDAATRRRIGFLPEQMRLPDYLKAASFLRYMGRLNGVEEVKLRERIPALLEQMGLAGDKKKLLREYSKGMQQRIGLAQVLLNDPDLLFLDEPTEGLDPVGRKQVRDLLVALRKQGKTIFLNSHLLSEIEQVCDQCVILRKGSVARVGTPAEFTRDTGEVRVRLAQADDSIRAVVAAVVEVARWENTSAYVRPRDRVHLNVLIDRLRAASAEIEAIEPVRSTLEEYFIGVVKEP